MKIEIIVPIIGVLIGWSLNEASQFVKSKREDRKVISNAIFIINDIICSLEQKKRVLESASGIEAHSEESNDILENLFKDKLITTNEFQSKVEICVSLISEFDPYLALDIKKMTDGVGVFKEFYNITDHNDIVKQRILYKLKMLNLWIFVLKNTVKKLSFRHSYKMYIKSKFAKKVTLKNDALNHTHHVNMYDNILKIKEKS